MCRCPARLIINATFSSFRCKQANIIIRSNGRRTSIVGNGNYSTISVNINFTLLVKITTVTPTSFTEQLKFYQSHPCSHDKVIHRSVKIHRPMRKKEQCHTELEKLTLFLYQLRHTNKRSLYRLMLFYQLFLLDVSTMCATIHCTYVNNLSF